MRDRRRPAAGGVNDRPAEVELAIGVDRNKWSSNYYAIFRGDRENSNWSSAQRRKSPGKTRGKDVVELHDGDEGDAPMGTDESEHWRRMHPELAQSQCGGRRRRALWERYRPGQAMRRLRKPWDLETWKSSTSPRCVCAGTPGHRDPLRSWEQRNASPPAR